MSTSAQGNTGRLHSAQELCGIWAYIKWEQAGCPNRSKEEADREYEAAIKVGRKGHSGVGGMWAGDSRGPAPAGLQELCRVQAVCRQALARAARKWLAHQLKLQHRPPGWPPAHVRVSGRCSGAGADHAAAAVGAHGGAVARGARRDQVPGLHEAGGGCVGLGGRGGLGCASLKQSRLCVVFRGTLQWYSKTVNQLAAAGIRLCSQQAAKRTMPN